MTIQLCYSANEEVFTDLDQAIDSVLFGCADINEAREAVIYVGEEVPPVLKAEWLFEHIQEIAQECVHDQVGEYAEHFEPKTDYDLALKVHLQQWIDKLKFNCYTVKNIKEVPLSDYVTEDELVGFFKD
jgi:hypothetical protein